MATIRTVKNENPFVMLDKRPLEDTRLSWEAKGIHAYLMSKPDSWKINVKHLIKQSRNGRDAVYRIINELIAAGYIVRNQEKGDDGTFKDIEYILHELPTHWEEFEVPKSKKKKKETSPLPENPDTENPDTDNSNTENPNTENPDISNNDFSDTEITEIKKDDDDSRSTINNKIFEKYKEKITVEHFAKVLERSMKKKTIVNYESYLTASVETAIKELKENEDAKKQVASSKEKKERSKPNVAKTKKEIEVIQPNTEGDIVTEEELEEMIRQAEEMQSRPRKRDYGLLSTPSY
ncbi:hypothetical protein [Mycobacterium tuberculosis]|uniref:hypothetical protein n=1 Tax=Mycobacterium tuberculosis TaxID=1773 RepID=UPI00091041F2|nr:hypothetical protein [Mycobacterium tuberculosis]SGI69991.1 Uncharacterised protein [Mycobacterium tuberculosis]